MMALLLNSIVMPKDLGNVAKDPALVTELVEICREVTIQYGPILALQTSNKDELQTVLATLSGVEFYLRRRAAEKVN